MAEKQSKTSMTGKKTKTNMAKPQSNTNMAEKQSITSMADKKTKTKVADKKFETTRKGVTHKLDKVFDYRDDIDMYTRKTKDEVKGRNPNVDHILEIQMMDEVWFRAPVAVREAII